MIGHVPDPDQVVTRTCDEAILASIVLGIVAGLRCGIEHCQRQYDPLVCFESIDASERSIPFANSAISGGREQET